MANITMDKTYRTRAGAAVRLLMTDGGGEYPVIGAHRDGNGEWEPERWRADGRFVGPNRLSPFDLVEVVAAEQKDAA